MIILPLDKGERGEEKKTGLKFNIQKTKIIASSSITSWQIEGEKIEAVTDFILLASKITADSDCSHEIKRHLLLGRKVMISLVVMYRCQSWTTEKATAKELILPNYGAREDS